jgi:hypothetical protein
MTADNMLFLMNLAAGCAIAYICLCRLNLTSQYTKRLVRLKYTLLMSGSLTLAGMPLLFQVPHTGLTLTAAVFVLILVMLEIRLWRHGPPACTYRDCK